ncbi:alpha/beta hydrolase [Rhizobium panacihumi]|uniref:alpha/beta hydrolase n=1 Tax=Rhizobium panacihumi TaxID=2008450 RepID=UPI003D794D31
MPCLPSPGSAATCRRFFFKQCFLFKSVGHRLAAVLLAVTAVLSFAGAATAQAESPFAFGSTCRADYRQYCRGVRPGGGAIVACLRERAQSLSPACGAALDDFRADRRRGGRPSDVTALPGGARVQHDVAYGTAPQQRLDLYRPDKPVKDAPVIVMVHGGAWALGSKSASNVIDNKVSHWLPKGVLFVSVETRLLPNADPLSQAEDVASALAFVQQKAASWGGDPQKIVLMGHSSGAHVAMLVTTDSDLARKAKLKPWLATIALDSAALDVTSIMRGDHARLYDRAFGKDPSYWAKASPAAQLRDGQTLPPILLVCSTLRRVSCDQARAFAQKAGGKAQVLPVALRHEDVNARLGTPGIYTEDVDSFLRRQGVR